MENTSFQSRIGASQNCVCLVMFIWFVFSLGHPVVVSQPTVVQLQPQGILNSHPVINVDGGTSPVGTVPVRILTPANSSIMNEKVSVTNAIISTGINNKKQDVSFTFLIVFFFCLGDVPTRLFSTIVDISVQMNFADCIHCARTDRGDVVVPSQPAQKEASTPNVSSLTFNSFCKLL